jgi:NodT family efflux transporter outer membrane factor (OMF) lipoprotein
MRPARLFAACALGTTAACAVGPSYKRPAAPVPPAYKEQAADAVPAGPWKPAEPRDEAPRGKWWEAFGDPRLNALEEQVDISNQNIAQAEATFRAARAAVRGARADFFPTVTTSPSFDRSHSSGTGLSSSGTTSSTGSSGGTTSTYQLPVDLSYEADVFGRIRRNVEGSKASAQASAADLETVRLTMQAELAVDYFQLRGLDSQKDLLDRTVAADEKALELTVNRHAQGVVSGVDVAQAETQLYTTRAQATDLGVARAQLEHAAAILLGRPPSELTVPPEAIAYAPPDVPVSLPSELLERRPDIAGSERRVASANAQIGVARAAFFPRLFLSASGGYSGNTLASGLSVAGGIWSIGSSLAHTLFDGGKRRAAQEQAEASYDAAVAAYRETVLGAFQDVEDNLAALRILAEEASQQREAVTAAERALALARNRYAAGITTYLEVITAENAALANERTAVDLMARRMTASVNLIKALGGGWRAPTEPDDGGAEPSSRSSTRSLVGALPGE